MRIHGIGTDIVAIERIRRALERHPEKFARKILSDLELRACARMPDAAPYAAKRFAAKEAFFKALGEVSSAANTWHQLSVVNDAAGRPRLEYGPKLAALLASKAIASAHVSLSDERTHAVAFVVLEKDF